MTGRIDRRSFSRLLGFSATAAVLPASPAAASPTPPCPSALARGEFPKGFLWGTATSAYQIEGAIRADGRGVSIWDTFTHGRKPPSNTDTADVADDEFHRYREDIAIMRELGIKAYQFSVSWPRIFPAGTGALNPKGWDFYDRMLDSVLRAGIEPYCCLFHWDMPQPLMDIGGWQNLDVVKALADYSAAVTRHLSDRVKNFITISEITTFIDGGYRYGSDAPGLKLTNAQVAQVNHNALLAHGMAAQAVRANARQGVRVGIADNAVSTCPIIDTPEHIAAARKAYREENGRVMTPIQEGRYTDLFLKTLGADAPKFTPEQMKIISTPLDFIGLNIYEPTWVRADDKAESGYQVLDLPKSYPHMAALWLQFGPSGMYWSPKFLHELWGVQEIYITENGAASWDVPIRGEVLDVDRVLFLRSYLTQLHKGISEGLPVKGYFVWTLMDNFEWSDGYPIRFGITYVDFATQKRTVKLSGEFYKEVIANNALM